jgi:hypothetical protein
MTSDQCKHLGLIADRAETGLLSDEDIDFLRQLANDVGGERKAITMEINQINLKISAINAQVANARSRNTYLKPDTYQGLMTEKRELRARVLELEGKL